MNRTTLFTSIAGLCLVIFLLVCILSTPQTSYGLQSIMTPTATNPANASTTPNSGNPGLPAIAPRTSSTSRSTPTFTLDDAKQYVNTHPLPDAVITGPKPVIIQAAFLPSQDISKRLNGESMDVPDGTILCYVELHGTFTFYGPSNIKVTYSTGVEIFDIHTGNLLVAGGR